MTPTTFIKRGDPIIVVACSATIAETEYDRVRMPTSADTPTCKTGLNRPCWAVPRWFLAVEPGRLTEYKGAVGGRKLQEIFTAWVARASDKANAEGVELDA